MARPIPGWFSHWNEQAESRTPRHGEAADPDATPAGFARLILQLGLVILVLYLFQIEEQRGLLRIVPLVFFGFFVHSLLPLRQRLRFFFLLSLGAYWVTFGATHAAILIAIGLSLVGLCHLPVAFPVRVVLVMAAGAMLAGLRIGWFGLAWVPVILPILGAMFLFRMIVYLYDIRHERQPVSVWQRLSYFFLLPNCLFPLFPVVDYSAFLRTYYDTRPAIIYQTGVNRIFRAITHLLVYRVIYHYFSPAAHEVHGLWTLVEYIVSGFLLYLRVSGLFHLIVGLLCLFGFHLPETNRLYLVSSGFNDVWRRVNIYWKDFAMKIFYYPIFVRLRRRGPTLSLAVATLLVFACGWLLHSFQWFWIFGEFPLTAADGIFWGLMGLCVLANSLWESQHGRRVSLSARAFSFRRAAGRSLRTVATMTSVFILWSLWSSSSISAWLDVMATASGSSALDFALLGLGLIALAAIGVLIQWVPSRWPSLSASGAQLRARTTAATTGGAVVLAMVGLPPAVSGHAPDVLARILDERLNARDDELLERGYYEDLLGSQRLAGQLWIVQAEQPADWIPLNRTEAVRITGDLLEIELLPSRETPFRGRVLKTNRWGFRDREYELEKPEGTYRIVQVGSSIAFGSGVENDETFEALVEERLNDELSTALSRRFEILNLALGGTTPIQHVAIFDRTAFQFQPDACLYISHTQDARRAQGNLSRLARLGVPLEYTYLEELKKQAGVATGMGWREAMGRFEPHRHEIIAWAYRKIATLCREHGAVPIRVFVPLPAEKLVDRVEGEVERLHELAVEAGFIDLDLGDVYGSRNRKKLILAAWDLHPNAAGHALIAKKLYADLSENAEALGVSDSGR